MYRLMIVDDEFEIRNGLVNYFPWKDIGYEVVAQAENGKEALEFIKSNEVDVILSDIKMPVMNGVEMVSELYRSGSKTKVVFLSGIKDFEYAREALKYGVKDYILKPTKYSELIEVFTNLKEFLDRESQNEKENGKINYYVNSISENSSGEEYFNYNEKVISTIKEYIENNYRDATLEDVAEVVHMNSFYLSRYFKRFTGKNFSDYLLDIRMKNALRFLQDINYKTYEVGNLVGYNDPKNFTRAFRKYFGISPRDYRKGLKINYFNTDNADVSAPQGKYNEAYNVSRLYR